MDANKINELLVKINLNPTTEEMIGLLLCVKEMETQLTKIKQILGVE